jgi:hypothetical protein
VTINPMTLKVVGYNGNGVLPSVLPSEYAVGPGENFVQGGTFFNRRYDCFQTHFVDFICRSSGGGWRDGALGLKFTIGGETHYGYVRILTGPKLCVVCCPSQCLAIS